MSIKLVRFSNGKFGVRKGNWLTGYRYIDLTFAKYWWTKYDRYFRDCMGREEVARHIFTTYKNNENLISDEVIE